MVKPQPLGRKNNARQNSSEVILTTTTDITTTEYAEIQHTVVAAAFKHLLSIKEALSDHALVLHCFECEYEYDPSRSLIELSSGGFAVVSAL